MSEIEKFQKDLAYALGVKNVSIQAPVPDKKLIGIIVPSSKPAPTIVAEALLQTKEYTEAQGRLILPVGVTELNEPLVDDMATWPHLLVAGSTGSGKSNWLHHVVTSLAERYDPGYLRFLLIDPRRVELTMYHRLPHLLTQPICDARKGLLALKWLMKEVDRRYDLLREAHTQSIVEYRAKEKVPDPMPYIVVIVDEMADCMMAYPKEYELTLVRILQMCRAVGVHVILSTQRSSVQCVTGLIRVNIPTRLAFTMASMIDSRTVLDQAGAEKLHGGGDALFLRSGYTRAVRIQTPFVGHDRILKVLKSAIRKYPQYATPDPLEDNEGSSMYTGFDDTEADGLDSMYSDVREFVLAEKKASSSLIQRRFRIGYGRAARLMDQLEEQGVISPSDETNRPRKVIVPE